MENIVKMLLEFNKRRKKECFIKFFDDCTGGLYEERGKTTPVFTFQSLEKLNRILKKE